MGVHMTTGAAMESSILVCGRTLTAGKESEYTYTHTDGSKIILSPPRGRSPFYNSVFSTGKDEFKGFSQNPAESLENMLVSIRMDMRDATPTRMVSLCNAYLSLHAITQGTICVKGLTFKHSQYGVYYSKPHKGAKFRLVQHTDGSWEVEFEGGGWAASGSGPTPEEAFSMMEYYLEGRLKSMNHSQCSLAKSLELLYSSVEEGPRA